MPQFSNNWNESSRLPFQPVENKRSQKMTQNIPKICPYWRAELTTEAILEMTRADNMWMFGDTNAINRC